MTDIHQHNYLPPFPHTSAREIWNKHQVDPQYEAIINFASIIPYKADRFEALFWADKPKAVVYWVEVPNRNYKPYSLLGEKHVNPDEVDYNPFWDKKAGWDEKHRIRFNTPFDDSSLNIDFLNATSAEGEPLIGSARLPLRDLVLGQRAVKKKLVLTCPSGSPIGEVTVMVAVRRVENPLPPEKTVTVVYEERAVDDFDEHDLT